MSKKMGVYQIRNLLNDKIYIGSSKNIDQRWAEHVSLLRGNYHHNPHLQNAWNKYGEDEFIFEMIEVMKDENKLLLREQWCLDNCSPDYNIALYASSPMKGRKMSDENRKRQSIAYSGEGHPLWGKHHSDSTKKKMSLAKSGDVMRGENNGMWGRTHTKEARKRISDVNKGRILSDERKKQIGDRFRGKKLSTAHREKIAKANSGENCYMTKLTWSSVREIRRLWKTGNYYQKDLADMFSTGVSGIGHIVNNRTWIERTE